MDEILVEISEMSADNLRRRLQEYGESVGPITKTTKSLFSKKLAKKIFQERYPTDKNAQETADLENSSFVPREENFGSDESQSGAGGRSKEESELGGERDNLIKQQGQVFYAISLSPDSISEGPVTDLQLVFTDKVSALKAVKMNKGSRFKMFKTLEDAERFSQTKAEQVWPSPMTSPLTDPSQRISTGVSVEAMPFKAPKMPELVCLRKMIEKGEDEAFRRTVWNNPRYLISSGDTPVILQEGFRYNALHVAAKSNQPSTCQLILDTIQDPDFIKTLYTLDTDETCNNRIKFLTDLYLNMPDKGNCESPLHFACKFGFVDIVEVLICHPRIDRGFLNKHGESAAEIVCSRCNGNSSEAKRKILVLLEGCCFVPLLRSVDNCTQPVIGEPWSPDSAERLLPVSLTPNSPKDAPLVVRAYAGPMTPSRADTFHKQWTTPPSGSPNHMRRRLQDIRREDSDKGVERIGRKLAQDLDVPWMEYWDFLNTYIDLSSSKGLALLERYLKQQSSTLRPRDAFSQDRLLKKNLKNNIMADIVYDRENPRLIEYSSHSVPKIENELGHFSREKVLQSLSAHKDQVVSDLSARLETLDQDDDRSSGSSSSGSSYASCSSGISKSSDSDSEGEKFHNSLDTSDGFYQDEVFEDNSKNLDGTETGSTTDDKTSEILSGLDKKRLVAMQMEPDASSTDSFNMYRCQTDVGERDVGSIDHEPVISTSPCMSPSVDLLRAAQVSNVLSPGTVDRMMTSLAADFESKLSITKLSHHQEDQSKESDSSLFQSMEVSANSTDISDCSDEISGSECSNKNSSNDARLRDLNSQSPHREANDVQSPRTPWQQTRRGSCYAFIQGNEPSKLDMDVLRAVGDVHVDADKYPSIAKWQKLVLSFNEATRQSWPTPSRVRTEHRLTGSPNTPPMSSPSLRACAPSPLATPAGTSSPHTGRQMTTLPRFNLLDQLRRSSDKD